MIAKTICALCLGFVAIVAAQHFWASSITARVRAEIARPSVTLPVSTFQPGIRIDPEQLRRAINPGYGRIDTSTGQRLAIEGAARRVDIETRNALSRVPLPPRGMPRF